MPSLDELWNNRRLKAEHRDELPNPHRRRTDSDTWVSPDARAAVAAAFNQHLNEVARELRENADEVAGHDADTPGLS